MSNEKMFDNSYCSVPQCKSKGMDVPRPSFHKFPKNINLQVQWKNKLKIGKPLTSGMRVCSKHFKASDFYGAESSLKRKMRMNVVPSLCLPVGSANTSVRIAKQTEIRIKRNSSYANILRKKNEHAVAGEEIPPAQHFCLDDSFNEEEINIAEAMLELANILPSSSQQEEPVRLVDACVGGTSGDLDCRPFKIDALSESAINSLTGINSNSLLRKLVDLFENKFPRSRSNHSLTAKEELVLTMMRIRVNIRFVVLAALFGCTPRTCKNIFENCVLRLAALLNSVVKFPDLEEISRNMPRCFSSFPNCKVVVDCTEIYVQKPKCLTCRVTTYSYYKKNQTVKVMVGVTPGGIISYIGKGYGGRASDKAIFKESAIINFLCPTRDSVMADKGFLIQDICDENYIKLIQPPFLKDKEQFSAEESKATKEIAAARVHVERVIQRIKVFQLLNNQLPWNLLPLFDDILVIVAGLVNLGSPTLADIRFNK